MYPARELSHFQLSHPCLCVGWYSCSNRDRWPLPPGSDEGGTHATSRYLGLPQVLGAGPATRPRWRFSMIPFSTKATRSRLWVRCGSPGHACEASPVRPRCTLDYHESSQQSRVFVRGLPSEASMFLPAPVERSSSYGQLWSTMVNYGPVRQLWSAMVNYGGRALPEEGISSRLRAASEVASASL